MTANRLQSGRFCGWTDAKVVDKEIEEKLVNGQAEEEKPAAVEEEKVSTEEQKPAEEAPAAEPESAEPELERTETAQADTESEKPKDPVPTPVETPKQAPQQPAPAPKPAVPAVPKTWASLAASANRVATPAAPQAAAPVAKPAAPKAAAPTAQPQASAPVAPAAPAQREEAKSAGSQDEWTAVGGSHNRQQSRQTNNVQPQEQTQNRGYIKNVHENIDAAKLRAELEKFGELQYFDVARQKNCAFVDFKSADAYNKAMSTPFKIDDAELYVEERRIRPGSTPYVPRGQFQGGRGGARGGPGGQGAPRRGGRGGFAANGQRGGRGGAQAQS